MEDKVIDIRPFIKKRKPTPKKQDKFGFRISCPECDSTEYWKLYCKEHIDKKLFVTAMVCTSDDCDGDTIIEISEGVLK